MGSVALLLEVVGESLDALVEFSGVLGDAVLHFVLDVEGGDDVVVFGGGHACSSVFLTHPIGTFFR
jgi:hypothetical protein